MELPFLSAAGGFFLHTSTLANFCVRATLSLTHIDTRYINRGLQQDRMDEKQKGSQL